ncbi:hypothetical protein SO694_00029387 [Aureococcus anophagefferens]|uniref:LamG-like jellyroll fold domain-containing protein n=1 Tax=Aureococcus anophagefferens TaxID=44056 RepID=A0ABR1FW33_AURAN
MASSLRRALLFRRRTAADDSGAGLDGWVSGATATTGLDARGALAFDGSGQYAGAGMVSSYLSARPRTVLRLGRRPVHGGDGYDTDVDVAGSDDGAWHHYCLTYDGSDWALYFDGLYEAGGAVALDTGTDYGLFFGDRDKRARARALESSSRRRSESAGTAGDGARTYALSGKLDEVYVYSSALDAASIQVLYVAVTAAPTDRRVWAVADAFDGGALFSVGSDADGREFGLSTDSGNPTPVDGRIQVQFYGGDGYDTDAASPAPTTAPGTTTASPTTGRTGRSTSTASTRPAAPSPSTRARTTASSSATAARARGTRIFEPTSIRERGCFEKNSTRAIDASQTRPHRCDGARERVRVRRPGAARTARGGSAHLRALGKLDEVYVRSSALDAASIQVLYAAVTAAPTVTPLPTHVSHSALVAHYSFDDGRRGRLARGLDGWVSGATATTGLDARGALAFDGSGQYAGAGMVSPYLSAALPRTACVWAVADAFDGGALFSVGSDADGREFGLSTDSGNPTPVDGRIQVLYAAVTAAPTVTPLPTHVSHSTLVAHYSFDDGTAADDYGSLGRTIHGATATTGRDGSGALSFDGTDDYAATATVAVNTGSDYAPPRAMDRGDYLDGSIDEVYVYASALDAASIQRGAVRRAVLCSEREPVLYSERDPVRTAVAEPLAPPAFVETIAVAYGPAIECSVPGAGAEALLCALTGAHRTTLECSELVAVRASEPGSVAESVVFAERISVDDAIRSP